MTEVRWERLTAPEIKEWAARDAVVMLPVAALEQHGPHLPVWTDSLIGHASCIRAAELVAEDAPALVLPPMWQGISEHHLPFGGTISLDFRTMQAVIACVAKSIMACGFRKLFLVNSHGGNIEPLMVIARELGAEMGIPVVTTTVHQAAAAAIASILETQPGTQHACEAETSLWLALEPDQVRKDEVAGALSNGGPSVGGSAFQRFWSFAERAPVTGVRGDPRAATAEKGERILAAIAEALARGLRDEALWATPDDVWTPGRAQRPA
ncbi:creatininase family protein [Roseomonas sp. SSH11]|uniref:Creatininase family protein n=1 Tax=Pararoseomonas baculiformis TaxID=2820812 RepID=A0ABS4AC26_9PROT|nr:creatininase family protein [Pararoseomonas baculiformis]MBP0444053.1 creatininase family protein [Pararoseomonas baculiformis]